MIKKNDYWQDYTWTVTAQSDVTGDGVFGLGEAGDVSTLTGYAITTAKISFGVFSSGVQPTITIKIFCLPPRVSPTLGQRYAISVAGMGINYRSADTFRANIGFPSQSVTVVAKRLKISYRCGGTKRMRFDSLKVYVGATEVASIGPWDVTYTGYDPRLNYFWLNPGVGSLTLYNYLNSLDTDNHGSFVPNSTVGFPINQVQSGEAVNSTPPPINGVAQCRKFGGSGDYFEGEREMFTSVLGVFRRSVTPPSNFVETLLPAPIAPLCTYPLEYVWPDITRYDDRVEITCEHRLRKLFHPKIGYVLEECDNCPDPAPGQTLLSSTPRKRWRWTNKNESWETRSGILLHPQDGEMKNTGAGDRSIRRISECVPAASASSTVTITDTSCHSTVDSWNTYRRFVGECEELDDEGTCIYSDIGAGIQEEQNQCIAFVHEGVNSTAITGNSIWPNLPACENPYYPTSNKVDADLASITHLYARINDTSGLVEFWQADNRREYTLDRTTTFEAQWVGIAMDKYDPVQSWVMATEESETIILRTIYKEGADWSVATTIGQGTKPTVMVGPNGVRHIYWLDGTEIKGQLRDRQNTLVETTFVVTTGVDDDQPFDVDHDVTDNGKTRAHLVCVKGGDVVHLDSPDGKTFS